MKRGELHTTMMNVLKQRNFAYMMTGIVGLSNVGLVLALLSQHEERILIPLFDIAHPVTLSKKGFERDYVVSWADAIMRMLYTTNPETVDARVIEVLKISILDHGSLQKDLEKWAQMIKKDQISTAFYPKSFDVYQADAKVLVKGTLMTYFGHDSKPVVEEKAYEVGWERMHKSLIILRSLKEVAYE